MKLQNTARKVAGMESTSSKAEGDEVLRNLECNVASSGSHVVKSMPHGLIVSSMWTNRCENWANRFSSSVTSPGHAFVARVQ